VIGDQIVLHVLATEQGGNKLGVGTKRVARITEAQGLKASTRRRSIARLFVPSTEGGARGPRTRRYDS